MYIRKPADLKNPHRPGCKLILLAFWTTGLLCGIIAGIPAVKSILSLMRGSVFSAVSIVGLFSVFALPFLLSALAVFIGRPRLLYVVAFGKAFSFSYCSWCLDAAFGSAGWLARLLLMFSDLCSLIPLLWFWLRHISGTKRYAARDLAVCAAAALLIGAVDYCAVSPFSALL